MANKKVNQALCGAALSIGTNIEIVDIPGYAPLINDLNMVAIATEVITILCKENYYRVQAPVCH